MTNYRIGYSTPNNDDYALATLGAALDEATALGVDMVELPLYALDVVGSGRIWPDRLHKLKALTAGRPLGYTIHSPLMLNLLEDDRRIGLEKDVLKATLEVTAELGAIHYVAHSGYAPAAAHDVDARFARQREIMTTMGDFAAAHGITIVMENLFGDEAMAPSRLAGEIAAIGHPAVAACFDVSHAFLLANKRGLDFLSEAAALAPHARQLHIHDSFGRLEGRNFNYRAERLAYGHGDLHLPIGRGSIPWDALVDVCRFPAGAVFIHELAPPYWSELAEAVAGTRALAEKTRRGTA